jgi:hypothetical protein
MVEQAVVPEEQKHFEKLAFSTYREYFDDSYNVRFKMNWLNSMNQAGKSSILQRERKKMKW